MWTFPTYIVFKNFNCNASPVMFLISRNEFRQELLHKEKQCKQANLYYVR